MNKLFICAISSQMNLTKQLFTTCLFSTYGLSLIAQGHQKPNILLILADDLGYKDCGFTGSKSFETPNIDELARNGMVFSKV